MTCSPFDRRSLLAAGLFGAGASASPAGPVLLAGGQRPGVATNLDANAVQQAYDKLAAGGGGTLMLPPGRHDVALTATTRGVQIVGHGRGVTILRPARAGMPAIRLLDARGEWTSARLADFSIVGSPGLTSDGIVCGHETYRHDDEYTGRMTIERVGFEQLDRCIVRPFGNIGLYIDDCTFGPAHVHLWSKSYVNGPAEMHAGCVQVTRSHFTGFLQAMAYFSSGDTVSGQVRFADCVFEAGAGFVFYLDGFRCVGGVPGLTVNGCWNEDTAQGPPVAVAGEPARKPRFIYAHACSAPITLRDTPPGTIELVASQVTTDDCALDSLSSALVDRRSQLVHRGARQSSGTAPGICLSIAGPTADSGLHTPWFRVELPIAVSAAYAEAVRLAYDGNVVVPLSGPHTVASTPIAGVAALPFSRQCQQIALVPGKPYLLGRSFATTGHRWIVTIIVYRLAAGGPVDIYGSGDHGFTGLTQLSSTSWECLVNLSFDEGPASQRQNLFLAARKDTTLQIDGVAVLEFDTRQEAITFANARTFPGQPV